MGMAGPSGGHRKAMSDINVTPFVDVMLVLLIIFMVTAPMMKQGLNVDLPETKGTDAKESEQVKPLVVTIKKNSTVLVGDTAVAVDLLSDKIRGLTENLKEKRVYIEADKKVTYDIVAKVMGEVQNAGVSNISLVTVPIKEK